MLKTAEDLLSIAAKTSLNHNRVRLINKRVYVHQLYSKSLREIYLPCITLGAAPLAEESSKDYEMYIRKERSEYDIFVWTRAAWGKRSWKSM